MRLSLKKPDYSAVITYANSSFASSAEQCQFNYDGSTSSSPFYQFFKDRNYFGASTSLHNKLVARTDPRDAVFFKPYATGGELIFAPNGTPTQAQGIYGISGLSIVKAPTFLLSYHEIEFLKAEAYARKNDLVNAAAELKKAIVAACAKSNVNISSTVAGKYFDNIVAPRLTTQASAIKEIMVQKYIAFFEEESVEAYNDIRRLKAMGEGESIQLSNPLNNTKFPLRFAYGSDDVTTNANIRKAYGDGSYVYTANVWWAGGSN